MWQSWSLILIYYPKNMVVWGILYDGVIYQAHCFHPSLGNTFFGVVFSKSLIWFKNEMDLCSHVASFKKRSTPHLRIFVHTYLGHTTPRSLASHLRKSAHVSRWQVACWWIWQAHLNSSRLTSSGFGLILLIFVLVVVGWKPTKE